MSPAESSPIKSLFLQCLKQGDQNEQRAFLDAACEGDEELKAEVLSLLSARNHDDSFLDGPYSELDSTASFQPVADLTGTQIGPYKLREQIGEGGFGVVYVAEQEIPVRRKVALKVIKPGMETTDVIARFEAERQALALMDHPSVATVLDAGATESGRPYFVMELVRGIPITEFCNSQKLDTHERLRLFIDVCYAVQHAHQKGIIHRDLKPSNVMVTMRDNRPIPKVIDFGVSKALSTKLTDKTVYTAYGQMIGTPLYMSPEQAQMNESDVDTRSDVYSLGVLLYELLTGTTPFDKETLRNSGFDEVRRIIREVEPPKPSARISTLAFEQLSTVSSERKLDPRKVGMSYRGELDWIVMKALEKDRNRRYESGSAFAADVERYLNNEPVVACPPSVTYRLRKFARRNRTVMISAALVFVTLVAGMVLSLWQAIVAHDARNTAQRRYADERIARREADAATQAETRQRKRAQANLRLARQAVDDMYTQVAEKWMSQRAQMSQVQHEFLEKALAVYEKLAEQNSDDAELRFQSAQAYLRVARICNQLERFERCEEACRKADEILANLPADSLGGRRIQLTRVAVLTQHGWVLGDTGRLDVSETAHRHALDISQSLARKYPTDPECLRAMSSSYSAMGNRLQEMGRKSEARSAYQKGLAAAETLVARFGGKEQDRRRRAYRLLCLGTLARDEQPRQSEELLRRAAIDYQRLIADAPHVPSHRHCLADVYAHLGNLCRDVGREDEAEDLLKKSTSLWEQLANDHPKVFDYRAALARAYADRANRLMSNKKFLEAENYHRKAMKLREEWVTAIPDRPSAQHELARSCHEMARLYAITKRQKEAEVLHRRGFEITKKLAARYPNIPRYPNAHKESQNQLLKFMKSTREPRSELSIDSK